MMPLRKVKYFVIITFLFLFVFILNNCGKKNELVAPGANAQIKLNVTFAKDTTETKISKSFVSDLKDAIQKKSGTVKSNDAFQEIDRVTVTVINSANEAVIEDQELTIEETTEGRFAVGTLSIPVNGDEETFQIIIRAFSGQTLLFEGSTSVTLSPGEVREEFVNVTLEPEVLTITVTPTNPTLNVGGTQQFTATANLADGSSTNVTLQAMWQSSNSNVASINSSGFATALQEGTTSIIATLGEVSGQTTLTVSAPTLVSIEVTPPNPSIEVGQTQQFMAQGTFSDNSTADVTNQVQWSSSNNNVASINTSGLATANNAGTTTITAQLDGVTGQTTLTVTPAPLLSIEVTPTNPSIEVGQTQQFMATGTFSDNSTADVTNQVQWLSSNAGVATIDATGVASGVQPGTTTITATQDQVTGSTTLNVEALPLLFVSPDSMFFKADSVKSPNPPPQPLSIVNNGGGTLNWSVSDDQPWLDFSPTSGSSTGETDNVTVSVNIAVLPAGIHNATITVTAPGAQNSPQTIQVTLVLQGPPTISNLTHQLRAGGLNACTLPDSSIGSLFDISFDYQDPDGDINAGAVVQGNTVFQPSGTEFPFDAPLSNQFNPFQGTIFFVGVCNRFGNDTSFDFIVSLTDAAGLTSNELTINVPRPTGANSPSDGTSRGVNVPDVQPGVKK